MKPPRTRRDPRPKSAREVALVVLQQVDTRKAFADLLLNQAFKQGQLDARDAALATELVNGTLRWRARLDWVLNPYVRSGLEGLSPWILNDLRLGLYQILFLDRVPDHAAVDQSVRLARKFGHDGSAGLVNAVLRRVLRERDTLRDPETVLTDPAEALAVAWSHPEWVVARWLRRFGPDETRKLLAANNDPPALGLRVNTMRTDRETLRALLADRGIETEASPVSRLSLVSRGNLTPRTIPEFQDGLFFVQDPSETLVVELLDPQPGERILDLCAAPGGKATQIQECRDDQGTVVAVDVQANRLGRIRENVQRLKLSGLLPVVADGRAFGVRQPFDRVLVDAPCSGLGVLGRRADARWRKTSASLRTLAAVQAGIISAAAPLVKPGGVLGYSVCSFEPEETTRVIEGFLKEHDDFSVEPAGEFLPADVVTDDCLLMLPHRHATDGAFAARLRRKD